MNKDFRLSSFSVRRIDWQKVDDTMRAMLDQPEWKRGGAVRVASTQVVDPQLVREAFDSVKREFQAVLKPLRVQMMVVSAIVLLSVAATVGGAALAMVRPWRGSVLSLAGIGSMFGFLARAWALSKDQAMLELIPWRYELALQLAASPEQYASILTEFMRESTSMRARTPT